MADYSPGEIGLMGKYWGVDNLVKNDGFWADVEQTLGKEGAVVTLPLAYNPQSVRRIQSMFSCPPGECGHCCRYHRIPITEADIKNIVDSGAKTGDEMVGKFKVDKDGPYFEGDGDGCPFLVDNACSIYEHRPNTCWLFPIMGEKQTMWGNKMVNLMQVRVFCHSTISLVRTIFGESINKSNGNLILLPDLFLVQKVV